MFPQRNQPEDHRGYRGRFCEAQGAWSEVEGLTLGLCRQGCSGTGQAGAVWGRGLIPVL